MSLRTDILEAQIKLIQARTQLRIMDCSFDADLEPIRERMLKNLEQAAKELEKIRTILVEEGIDGN